jgi:catechol 2,3-dioxygenase-like lactoylglutathione lyase family enzyme
MDTLISRRRLLQALGLASFAAPVLTSARAFAQGRCMTTFGAPECNTASIPPVFKPTGWKTAAFDHVTFQLADYRKEAAFYVALMGWTLRSDDGTQAVLDMGEWGTAVFRQAAPGTFDAAPANSRRGPVKAMVTAFGFAIDGWNAKTVEQELKARGLAPVADNDGHGFESFHVTDPDGFDLQIGNAMGHVKARKAASAAKLSEPAPFASTGWKTVWLDHFSFNAADYKKSASFYQNLLGWGATYDEGSQHELMMGDAGDIIVRGGNALVPEGGRNSGRAGGPRIDHISFGIAPWDTDDVKAQLEKRGLKVTIDTSSRHKGPDGTWVPDEIHTAAFKSYHTDTPNGYNLQISYVTHDNRLALANAVDPRKVSGSMK